MILADFPARSSCARNCLFPVGGCIRLRTRLRRDRVDLHGDRLSRRSVTKPEAASEARREIARNAPPSVVFYETAVDVVSKAISPSYVSDTLFQRLSPISSINFYEECTTAGMVMCCLVCKTVEVRDLVCQVSIVRGTCQPEGDSRSGFPPFSASHSRARFLEFSFDYSAFVQPITSDPLAVSFQNDGFATAQL